MVAINGEYNSTMSERSKFQIVEGIISNSRKRILFCLLIIMSLLIGCAKEETTVKGIPSGMEVTKLSDILENPADYDNKKVLLEGIVGRGCLGCPSHFPYQEGINLITIYVKGFERPDLKQGDRVRIYAEVKAEKERVVISALAMEVVLSK